MLIQTLGLRKRNLDILAKMATPNLLKMIHRQVFE